MKKSLAVLLAACLALSLMACGGTPSSSTPAASTPASVPTPSEPAQSEPQGGVELTYWSMWNSNEPQGEALQEQISKWEAETGNTVNIEWKGRDIRTIIAASLDAQEKIDLFDDDFQTNTVVLKDSLFDMTDLAAAAGYEDYCVEAFPNAVRGWADGKLVTIAYQPYTSGVFYNKQAFVDAEIEAEPQTWAEFLDVCEKLKAAGYEPIALDDAYVDYAFSYHLARYLGQDAVKELSLNGGWGENEAVLKAAQDIVDLIDKGYLSKNAPGAFPEGENEIGYEESAMIVNASWVPAEITNNTGCDLEWGMFNYPTVEGGKDPNTVANVGAQGFCIPAYSENAEAAFDLIMYLTSGEADQAIALATDGMPSDTRNTEWPEMIAGCRDAFNSLTGIYDWNAGLTENGEIATSAKEACQKLFEGKLDAAGFVAELDAMY